MERKSIVKSVNLGDAWSNDFGTFYPFTIEFENGDKGTYNCKSDNQSKFVVGKEVDYLIETKGNNTLIKPPQQNNFGGKPKVSQEQWDKLNAAKAYEDKKRQFMIIQQSCMGYAIEILKSTGTDFSTEDVFAKKDELTKHIFSETKKVFK